MAARQTKAEQQTSAAGKRVALSALPLIFMYQGTEMKKWSVTLSLLCVLFLGGLQNVLAQEPAYLKDMPTVSEIMERIKGANEAQTLGRQCAAFSRLENLGLFPFMENGRQLVGGAWIRAYRDAASQLGAQFKGASSEWSRMCMNWRSGYRDLSGLDEPVKDDELTALFKPSVLAAYEQAKGQTPRSVFAPQGQQSHINQPVMDYVLGGVKQINNQLQTEQKAAKERYTQIVNTWVGSDINDLVVSWGAPSGQSNAPNGGVIYEWLKSQSIFYAAHEEKSVFGYSHMIPSQTVTDWCKTQFLTNRAGKITETVWEGNACY